MTRKRNKPTNKKNQPWEWQSGERIRHKETGETGELRFETFRGPGKGYRLGWRVYFDNDYSTWVLSRDMEPETTND